MDVFVTEHEGQTVVEEKSIATPVPTITVELVQSGAPEEQLTVPTGQPPPVDVAMVVEPDIWADNGVIHAIDLVLLPPEVRQGLQQRPSG
jgi:uncharacterized surface protein with fasciclin (FAS1) repeats